MLAWAIKYWPSPALAVYIYLSDVSIVFLLMSSSGGVSIFLVFRGNKCWAFKAIYAQRRESFTLQSPVILLYIFLQLLLYINRSPSWIWGVNHWLTGRRRRNSTNHTTRVVRTLEREFNLRAVLSTHSDNWTGYKDGQNSGKIVPFILSCPLIMTIK